MPVYCEHCKKPIKQGQVYTQSYGHGYITTGPDASVVDWEIEPDDDQDRPYKLCKTCALGIAIK